MLLKQFYVLKEVTQKVHTSFALSHGISSLLSFECITRSSSTSLEVKFIAFVNVIFHVSDF